MTYQLTLTATIKPLTGSDIDIFASIEVKTNDAPSGG